MRRLPPPPATRLLRAGALALLIGAGAGARADTGGSAPVAPLEAGWSWEARATLRFLEHLGWRVEVVPGLVEARVEAGRPGFRASLAQAQAAGDLRLLLPDTPLAGRALERLLPAAADGPASRLAWQHRVSEALVRATDKLTAATKAGRYKFPQLLFWNSPFFQFHPPRPEWTERERMFVVVGRPSAALEAIYRRGALAECYTGQWVLVYATMYELFGAEAFDAAFPAPEVVVGRPSDVRTTPIGQTMLGDRTYPYRALLIPPEQTRQDPGATLAALGPLALVGLTGIVRNQDETDGANQNLTIVSVSPRAAEALRTQGGFGQIARLGRQAAEAWNARGGGPFGGGNREAAALLERTLADPLLAEIRVYVHPFGVVPLAEMFRHELDDTEKPLYVLPYVHGREDLFYRRYRAGVERRWLASQGAPLPPGPGAPSGAPSRPR